MRRLYQTIDSMQAAEGDLLDAVPHEPGAEVWDLIEAAFDGVGPVATLEDLFAISTEIDGYSVLRGGPRSTSRGDDDRRAQWRELPQRDRVGAALPDAAVAQRRTELGLGLHQAHRP